MRALFPERAQPPRSIARAHQLALGFDAGWRRVGRCPSCAVELEGDECATCEGFVCALCDRWTSENGGEAGRCYRCLR